MPKDSHTETDDFYFRMVAQHTHEGLIVTDAKSRVVWANTPFLRRTGYGLEELVGRTPGETLYGPMTSDEAKADIEEARRTRRPAKVEVEVQRKDNTPYWAEVSLFPVFDENGTHTHFISVERDVTTRREQEARTAEIIENERHREE